MSGVIAAVRRHLPGGRSRAVRSAFVHGWHAGHHDAVGVDCCDLATCEVWRSLSK